MSKVEKYYNFIVDDLMKDTYESDHDTITTPIQHYGDKDGEYYIIREPFKKDIRYNLFDSPYFPLDLFNFLTAKYGIGDEDFNRIRDIYMESFLKKYVY